MPKAIEIFDLSKRFTPLKSLPEAIILKHKPQKPVTALDRVNLEIGKGQLFCLLGLNGAGKTTLLKILATLILPSAGSARVNGFDLAKENMQVKQSVGLSADSERSFYWRLTGRENLSFFAYLHNIEPKQINQRINHLSNILDISKLLDKKYAEYSQGTKQRFSIARSLIHDPAILLLDEPTKSLDSIAARKLWFWIKTELLEKREKTVIFATHNFNESSHADKVAFMQSGQVKIVNNLEHLKQSLNNPKSSIDVAFNEL